MLRTHPLLYLTAHGQFHDHQDELGEGACVVDVDALYTRREMFLRGENISR